MGDGVDIANVGKELIPQPLTLRGSGHEAGDIHELNSRRHDLLRVHDVGELLQARVGHRHDPDVGVDRAERIVLGRDLRPGESIEQGRLADVRQAHDAAADCHSFSTTPESVRRRDVRSLQAGGAPLRVCRPFMAF